MMKFPAISFRNKFNEICTFDYDRKNKKEAL